MGQNGILKLFYFDLDLKLYGKMFLGEIIAGNKITPGVGVTLLLGAVGSFYLIMQSGKLVSKLTQRKKGSKKPNEVCFMCNANIDFDDTKSFTICKGCERFVCKNEKCAEWISSIGIWECGNCQSKRVDHTKASEWLLQQLNFRIRHPGPANLKDEKLFIGNDSDDARSTTSSITSNQRIKVREFIEELLSSILKGSLDDVTVGPISKNRDYLPLWEGEGEECPGDNHIELKRLIQNIIEEVSKIPELLGHVDFPNQKEPILPFFDPKKYEQLLATAVLNKVVQTYRNNKNFPDNQSSGVHTDSELDNNHNIKGKRKLSTENSISDNAKQISMEINDPKQKSDLNNFGRRASDTDESYLSDYIQKHKVPLPDLSSDSTSGGEVEDDVVSLKSNGTDGTWEENWLFKKRQLKMSETSIAMLVPSPTEDIKALIGDKNADEVSDLSEAGSDDEGQDGHDIRIKNVQKSVINSSGSKLDSDNVVYPDSLTSLNSMPSSSSDHIVLSEAKNDVLLIDSNSAINNQVEIKMNGGLSNDLLEFEAVNTTIHMMKSGGNAPQKEIEENEKSLLLEENNFVMADNELALITDDCKIMNELINGNTEKNGNSNLGNNVVHQEQKIPVPSPRTRTPSSESEQRKPKVFARSDDDDDESENEEQIVPLENQPASLLEFESLTNDLTDMSLLPESKSLMSLETTTSIENSQFYEEDFSSITNQEIETNNFIEEQDYTSSIYPTEAEGGEIIEEKVKFKTPEKITMHMKDFKTLVESPMKTNPTDNEITMDQDTVAYHKNNLDREKGEKVPIRAVTKQMIQYCEELKSLLYLSALKKDEKFEKQKVNTEEPKSNMENPEALEIFKEELVKANAEQCLELVQECKHNYGKSEKKREALDLAIYPTAMELCQKSNEDYSNRLKNLEVQVNGTTACNIISQFELTKHDSRVITSNNNLSPTLNVTNNSNYISTNNHLIPLEDSLSSDSTVTAQSMTSDSNNNNQSEDSLEQDILIPGSIAEREHLKWKNAAPIANNPYSPDALKKRLSEVERKSEFFDLGRVTPDKLIEMATTDDMVQETIVHPALDSEPVDVLKYGRDYYINSAKFASGSARKRFSDLSSLSQSTDDEKSMLLSSKKLDENDELITKKPVIRSQSFGGEQKKEIKENIFDEKPIKVNPDDPILKKGVKLDYLTTENREFYLVPVEDTVGSSSSTLNSPTSPRPDSLTFSEDSDITRIYDLATGEMKIIHAEVKDKIPSPPRTPTKPIKTEIATRQITLNRPIVTVKPLSPETIRIFAPKNRSSITTVHEEDHNVIEKEVANVLPSVKQLAMQYTSPKQENNEPPPINKPTSFVRKSSTDATPSEEKPIEIKKDEVKRVYKPKYNPPTYSVMAPGHSITARSLSKQIREELKHNATDDIKEKTTKRQPSPERPPSPIFVKGMTKNSIQFFENLKKKQ